MKLIKDLPYIFKGIVLALVIVTILSVILLYTDTDTLEGDKESLECVENETEEMPMWRISNPDDWEFGRSDGIELNRDGGYIKLEEGVESGNWVSTAKNWGVETKYYYADVDSEIRRGDIQLKFETSNNDFETVRDNVSKELSGGIERINLCSLENSTSLRIRADVEIDNKDKELTTLHGIWVYFRPLSNETPDFSNYP